MHGTPFFGTTARAREARIEECRDRLMHATALSGRHLKLERVDALSHSRKAASTVPNEGDRLDRATEPVRAFYRHRYEQRF
jgi:hypothetical protein